MRKLQMVLAGVFLGGVLLGGIGTGIALVEYSSLSYGGKHLIGEESLVTDNLDFEFEPGENLVSIDYDYYMNRAHIKEIESDPKVPAGVVRYEVTYNEKRVTPFLVFDRNEEMESWGEEAESEVSAEPVYLGRVGLTASYQDGDLEVLMENKDRFLEELKSGVISDYQVLYITDVKIKVNPATLPYVKLER